MARALGGSRIPTLAIGAAVVVGAGVVTWVIYGIMSHYQGELEAARGGRKMVEVVQAAREIAPGEVLAREDLSTVLLPEGSFPTGQVFLKEELGDAVGTIPAERIFQGETLRKERMDVRAARAALDRIIAPGARAATLLLDSAAGMAGLLRPSDQVDVIVTIRPDSETMEADWVTETILQNVRVLAVDRAVIGGKSGDAPETEKNDKKKNSSNRKVLVTVEVLPEEAEKLALAATRGDLQLSLRGADDDSILEDKGPLVTNTLVGISKMGEGSKTAELRTQARTSASKPAPTAPASHSTTEVIIGDQRTTSTFDEKGTRIDASSSKR